MGYITRMSYVVSSLRSRKKITVFVIRFNVNCKLTAYNTYLHDYYWYLGNVKCMP